LRRGWFVRPGFGWCLCAAPGSRGGWFVRPGFGWCLCAAPGSRGD